jgi:hypothetical protein
MSRFGETVLLCAVLAAMALPTTSHAQWAWRDKTKNNQVTYSDEAPPPHIPEGDVLKRPNTKVPPAAVAPSPASARPALAPIMLDPKLQAKRREAEKQAAAEKQKEDERIAATRAANCESARTKLRTIESGIRMARTNKKGETEILDDQARQAETRQAQDVIKSECN